MPQEGAAVTGTRPDGELCRGPVVLRLRFACSEPGGVLGTHDSSAQATVSWVVPCSLWGAAMRWSILISVVVVLFALWFLWEWALTGPFSG